MTNKSFDSLTFTDDFMFCAVLQDNEDLCRELVELILNVKVKGIVRTEKQKGIEITADGKGVRFDVCLEDEVNTVYDIEMQTSSDPDLPKRSRYYQGMIDLNLIRRGAKYSEFKRSCIIFINTFDAFGLDQCIYTFRSCCEEVDGLILDDGATRVFLNAKGRKGIIFDELKGFLDYLASGVAGNDLSRRLELRVAETRRSDRWRLEHMTLEMKLKEREDLGHAIGLAEGRV